MCVIWRDTFKGTGVLASTAHKIWLYLVYTLRDLIGLEHTSHESVLSVILHFQHVLTATKPKPRTISNGLDCVPMHIHSNHSTTLHWQTCYRYLTCMMHVGIAFVSCMWLGRDSNTGGTVFYSVSSFDTGACARCGQAHILSVLAIHSPFSIEGTAPSYDNCPCFTVAFSQHHLR